MSLLGPILTPLRSLAFALGGALLAWAWFSVSPAIPICVVAGVWFVTVAVQARAKSLITTKPQIALQLFEWRLLGIVVVSAGAAALVIVVTVWFTLDDEQKTGLSTSTQQVLAAVGAALTAFIGAVSVSAESADENIGDLVKSKFREKFVVDEPAGPGQVRIDTAKAAGSRADRALNSVKDYGWTDWSKDTRAKRVQAISAYLES